MKALRSWTTVKPVKLMQTVRVIFGKVEDGFLFTVNSNLRILPLFYMGLELNL